MNPLLYKNAAAFNDVIVGNNSAGTSDGFQAEIGWDPASGLGTINFAKLVAAVV